jgi:16S rRNA (adenine1518-N6/adenine1519-N6)-dimethyltransferase
MIARKRFGQHFLHDPTVIARIVAAIGVRPDDALVEVGPGPGVLTRALQGLAQSFDAIEIDRDLVAALEREFPPQSGIRIHSADALSFDFAALARERGSALRVVGNLPYNISTPLLFHLLEARAALRDLHVMLQREVVERIVAPPDTREYGRLTVMLAPWVRATPLFEVGPGAFRPPPKVWSAVVRLEVLGEPAFEVVEGFGALVAAAFSQRRKTLRNALREWLPASAIESAGIDPAARPDTVPPAGFAALARAVARR